MKKVYIAEKKGVRFYVDQRDPETDKRIPKVNEDGNRIPGQFEQHRCNFDQFESVKRDGERIYKSVFIVDENTPPEVATYVENHMVKNSECELEEDHIRRINPKQAEALLELGKVRDENKELLEKNAANESKLEALEAMIAEMQTKKRGRPSEE